MLEKLPGLAVEIKEFVRDNPGKDAACGEVSDAAVRAHVARRLVEAAKAGRVNLTFEVENTDLSLARLKAFENTVNVVPLERFPGIGQGLLRVLDFSMGPAYIRNEKSTFVTLEFSPLGWPELPEMVHADHNILFREARHRACAIIGPPRVPVS